MKKIVFLCSGDGGTLKFLYEAIKLLNLPFEIIKIIVDRECGALDFAKKNAIPSDIIKYSQTNTRELEELLKSIDVDIIVTNIHKILSESTLTLHSNKYINLHYSLLPAFSGMIGMQTVLAAKEQNVQIIGGTCHYVDNTLDGGIILAQGGFSVDWNMSLSDICNKVFRISCLTFLNGLMTKEKLNFKNEKNSTSNLFNPPLRFGIHKFDEYFWNKVKQD